MVRVSVRAQSSKYGRTYGKGRKRKSKAAAGRKQVLNITREEIRKAMLAGADLKYSPIVIDDVLPGEALSTGPRQIITTNQAGTGVFQSSFAALQQGDGVYARQDNQVHITRIMLKGTIYWGGANAGPSNYVPQNVRVIFIRCTDERTTQPLLDEFLDIQHLTVPTPDYSPTYAPVRVKHERRSIQILYDRMFYDPGVQASATLTSGDVLYTSQRAFNVNLTNRSGGFEANYTNASISSFNQSSGSIWMYFLMDDNATASVAPRACYMRAVGRVEFKDL